MGKEVVGALLVPGSRAREQPFEPEPEPDWGQWVDDICRVRLFG